MNSAATTTAIPTLFDELDFPAANEAPTSDYVGPIRVMRDHPSDAFDRAANMVLPTIGFPRWIGWSAVAVLALAKVLDR